MVSISIHAQKIQSQKTRNKHRKLLKLFLGIVFLGFCGATFFVQPSYATRITKNDVKKVGSFKAERYGIQGGTITEKYYIFADKDSGQNGLTTIRFFRRSDNKEERPNENLIAESFMHSSNVYYEWGSGYAQVADAGSGNWWCFDVNAKKQVSTDKCGSFLRSGSLDHGSVQKYRQGWTKYGDHYFRAYGDGLGLGNNVEVYDESGKFLENIPIDSNAMPSCEIEDVAVDGNQGILYVLCDGKSSGHAAEYYRINKSLLSGYISPGSSSSSSGGGSADIFSPKPYNPADDNLTVRDESYFDDPPVSTYDGTVETKFFGTIKDEAGCGVYTTLSFIIDILSIGIGVAAAIGITLSGIIYLTAKGDVARTTKAKRRIYEIVIGLIAYAIIYALLTFLTPEFNPELKICKALTEEEVAQIKAETAAKKAAIKKAQAEAIAKRTVKGNYDPKMAGYNSYNGMGLDGWYKAIKDQAEFMKNATYGINKKHPSCGNNYESNFDCSKYAGTCITYVSTALQRLGVIPKNTYVWISASGKLAGSKSAVNKIKKNKDTFEVFYPNKTIKQLKKENNIRKGDIIAYNYNRGSSNDRSHIMIFMGFDGNGNPRFNSHHPGGMHKYVEHDLGSTVKINMIIRLKKSN